MEALQPGKVAPKFNPKISDKEIPEGTMEKSQKVVHLHQQEVEKEVVKKADGRASSGSCSNGCKTFLSHGATVLAVIALAALIIGLGSYFNYLHVGLSNVGVLTNNLSFWTAFGGGALLFTVLAIRLGVSSCTNDDGIVTSKAILKAESEEIIDSEKPLIQNKTIDQKTLMKEEEEVEA